MWLRACAALLLCCWCWARAADGELATGGGAAVAAGEAREARFVLGSRYGRSAPAPRYMSPRNDRFFMSSRYGKRSGGGARGGRGERACRCAPDRPYRAPLRYNSRQRAGGAAGGAARAG